MKFVTIPGSFSEAFIDTFSVVSEYNIDYSNSHPECCKDKDDIRFKVLSDIIYKEDIIYVYSEKSFNIADGCIAFITFNFTHYTELNIVNDLDLDYDDKHETKHNPIIGFNSYREILDYKHDLKLRSRSPNIKDSDIITFMIIETKQLNIYINGLIFTSYDISLEPGNYRWQIVCHHDNYLTSDFMNGKFYYYESGIYLFSNKKYVWKNTKLHKLTAKNRINVIKQEEPLTMFILMKEFPYILDSIANGMCKIKQNAIIDYERVEYKANKEKRKQKNNIKKNNILQTLKFNKIEKDKYNHILCPSFNCICNNKNCNDRNYITFKNGYECPGIDKCKYYHPGKYHILVDNLNLGMVNQKTEWFIKKYIDCNSSLSIFEDTVENLCEELLSLKKSQAIKNKTNNILIKDLRLQNEQLSYEPNKLQEEIDLQREEIKQKKKEIHDINIEFSKIKTELMTTKNKKKKLEKDLEKFKDYPKIKTSLNKQKKENEKLLNQIKKLNNDLEIKDKEIKDKEADILQEKNWNKEYSLKNSKLNGELKGLRELKKIVPEYEDIITSLNKQIEYLSTKDIIEVEKIKKPKNESRIKIIIDGILYDDKHPKWRKIDSKRLNLFHTCLHDGIKIKTLITNCGWELIRTSNHNIFTRTLENGEIQKFVSPTTPAEWHTTWIILKRLEEERIQLELA